MKNIRYEMHGDLNAQTHNTSFKNIDLKYMLILCSDKIHVLLKCQEQRIIENIFCLSG